MKQLKIILTCLLMLTVVACGVFEGEEARDMYPHDEMEALDDDFGFDDYQRNEDEQLNGGDEIEGDLTAAGLISNAKTDLPSNKYPHTKAVQIQQAKFKFVVDGKGVNVKQGGRGLGLGKLPGVAVAPTPAQRQAQVQQPKAPIEEPEVATPQPTPAKQQSVAQPTQERVVQQPEQQQAPAPAAEPKQQQQATGAIGDMAARVIELTNAERRKNGLPDYQADTQLSNVAKVKSDDMQQNNYFSHTSPTHGSPFDMIRDHGVSYSSAGENIAKGQTTAEQVVQSWMNSEGHRKNILSGDFTHIGVGYNQNGHYWTQMFIRK